MSSKLKSDILLFKCQLMSFKWMKILGMPSEAANGE